MNEVTSELIDIHRLQIGMFIDLEVGWMSHPFPSGSFKISSDKQIEIIRGLGLQQVRYVPEKSDLTSGFPVAEVAAPAPDKGPRGETELARSGDGAEALHLRKHGSDLLGVQQRNLIVCERRFGEATRQYKQVVEQLNTRPSAAMEQSLRLVSSFVSEMLGQQESIIRLLSETMGDRAAMHPVNVTIVSLLLGKALGLPQSDMIDLGMGAFLHDIGKSQLPDRVRWLEENFSSVEYKLYQDHVGQGVVLARRMDLSAGAVQAIAQHHELIDGSGFPARLKGDSLSTAAKIVSLVNRYDNLCNPGRSAAAITPHEALSLIFAQLKMRFDGVTLSAFIRMMGVYPPGSIVQLVDGRFAIVVSVNSTRPLKPRVIVHEPGISTDEALILDLEQSPTIGIRRSLKPASLPPAALNFLSPRRRMAYFYESAIDSPPAEESL